MKRARNSERAFSWAPAGACPERSRRVGTTAGGSFLRKTGWKIRECHCEERSDEAISARNDAAKSNFLSLGTFFPAVWSNSLSLPAGSPTARDCFIGTALARSSSGLARYRRFLLLARCQQRLQGTRLKLDAECALFKRMQAVA